MAVAAMGTSMTCGSHTHSWICCTSRTASLLSGCKMEKVQQFHQWLCKVCVAQWTSMPNCTQFLLLIPTLFVQFLCLNLLFIFVILINWTNILVIYAANLCIFRSTYFGSIPGCVKSLVFCALLSECHITHMYLSFMSSQQFLITPI